MAMIAMTTSSSINVNARRGRRLTVGEGFHMANLRGNG
jgi:hypothetical protein